MIENFKKYLNLKNKIGLKARGKETEKKYFHFQFGDKNFYEFLVSIGLMPKKSKTLSALTISRKYFDDFLRGCIDGDGSIGFYNHPESKHPQLRIRLCSASHNFLKWIKSEIQETLGINNGWIENKIKRKGSIPVLSYGKSDSIKLISVLYKSPSCTHLSRKYEIVKKFYGRVAELV